MKRKMTRLLMILLSYSPIATVAVAAQAKASEMDGEIQSAQILRQIQGARYRVLPPLQMTSTIEEAKARYSGLTGLKGDDLEQGMTVDLQNLVKSGLIQFDEKSIMAMGPSEHS